MELYEGIKNIAKAVQHTENDDLYTQLIELSAQALDMENELTHLRSENAKLIKEKENCIERHDELYITLKGDADKTLYCSHCWDHEHHLVQVKCYDSGSFKCAHCANNGVYDYTKWNS